MEPAGDRLVDRTSLIRLRSTFGARNGVSQGSAGPSVSGSRNLSRLTCGNGALRGQSVLLRLKISLYGVAKVQNIL
jgi:hypothetical protein